MGGSKLSLAAIIRGLIPFGLIASLVFPIPAPHRVLLVIDTNFQESVSVGQYYRQQRGIPDSNIVSIGVRDSDRYNNYYSSGTYGNFSNDVLAPILDAIHSRGLADTIDYIVLSYGIPVRMQRPGGSTYFSTASYLATWLNFSNTVDWSGTPPYAAASAGAFSCTNLYPGGKRFRLATHLYGYRGDEVKAAIDQSVLGDGSQVAATNGLWVLQVGPYNVFGTPPHTHGGAGAPQLATNWTNTLGLRTEWHGGSYNYRAANTTNVLVLLHGGSYAGYTYFNYGAMFPDTMAAPGGYVEAHESFGLLSDHFFETRAQQQFPMPLYLRMGYATMSGAVIEPFLGFMNASCDTNSAERFRSMYMRGYTSLEAAYFASWRDERGPTTFVGDPLCRPFARIPTVSFAGPADGDTVSNRVQVSVSATAPGAFGIGRIELYADSMIVPVASASGSSLDWVWTNGALTDGAHTLYAVAYENDAVRSPGWKAIRVYTTNSARTVAITSPAPGSAFNDSDISVNVSAGGAYDQVRLLVGTTVVAVSPAAGSITILKSKLTPGENQALTAQLTLAGAVVCTSAPVLVSYSQGLRILYVGTTNSGTNLSASNVYSNLDYRFSAAALRVRATNFYPGADLYLDGVKAELLSFEPVSSDSDVADAFYRIPTFASSGVKSLALSNLSGATAATNVLVYAPVPTALVLSPATLMVAPGERLKIDGWVVDQHSNRMPSATNLVWNSFSGGTLSGPYYVAGPTKGDFACCITLGGFTTNITIGIHDGRTNYFDSFDATNHWTWMSASSPWSAGANEFIANASSSESSVYLNKVGPHRTNFKGIVQCEGMLKNSTAGQAFFGVRVLGELWPSAQFPNRRNYGYGLSVYPDQARYHYQNISSLSGAYASTARAFATNVWYTIRLEYDQRSAYAIVLSNGVKQAEYNFYYQNTPVYTNTIRLVGAWGSKFRNFKVMDWDAADLSPTAPAGLQATNASSNAIDLVWNDLSGNETGFNIWCSTNRSNYILTNATAPNATSLTVTGLAPSTDYWFRITATNASGDSLFDGPVHAQTKAACLPAAPSRLAGALAVDTVILTWGDDATNESGFVIERSVDGVSFSPQATAIANTNRVDLFGLPSGQSWFRVAATNSAGVSPWAGPYCLQHFGTLAPTNLALNLSGPSNVTVTWFDASSNELGFIIYRNWSPIWTNGPGASSFIDSNQQTNAYIYYYVSSFNAFSVDDCPWKYIRILPAPPAAPSNLTVSQTSSALRLAWVDYSSNESAMNLWRSIGGGPFALLTNLAPNTASFEDLAFVPGASNAYRVSASNWYGESAFAGPEGLLPPPPAAPSNLTVAPTGSALRLTWTDWADNESALRLYRSVSGGPFLLLTNLPADTLEFDDLAFVHGVSNAYRLAATNVFGESAFAGPVAFLLLPPAAPTNLSVAQGASGLIVAWGDAATNEFAYRVARSINGAPFAFLTNLPADTELFEDLTFAPGVSNAYRVSASNALGESAFAGPVGFVPPPPAAPTHLVAEETTANSLRLSWSHPNGANVHFIVYRSLDLLAYSPLSTTGSNASSFSDTGLTPFTRYAYRVSASNQFGESPASLPVSLTPARRVKLTAGSAMVDAVANRVSLGFSVAKNCVEPVALTFRLATAGSGSWVSLASNDLDGALVAAADLTNAALSNAWRVPAGFDVDRRCDLMICAAVPGTNAPPLVLSNIDLAVLFRLYGDLARACAVNNPWRGEGEGIVFVNLTRETTARIFTISGKLVREIKAPMGDPGGRLVWAVGQGERPVSPGVYFALLSDPAGGKKLLRVMVLP